MYDTHLQRTISYCRRTYILAKNTFFAPLLVVKNSTPFHAELYSEAVHSAVGHILVKEPNVLSTTEVQWKGTKFKKGRFLCLNQGEGT